jgi:hypothetical protein
MGGFDIERNKEMHYGTIVEMDMDRQFGRVLGDDGMTVPFFSESVVNGGFERLYMNQRVSYEKELIFPMQKSARNMKATRIRPL